MFVSAYSTFVRTENTNDVKNRSQRSDDTKKSFELKSAKNILSKTTSVENFPLSYISNYKTLCNKQKISRTVKKRQYNKIHSNKN